MVKPKKKTVNIIFKVDPELKEQIETHATQKGLTTSAYLRMLAIEDMKKRSQ